MLTFSESGIILITTIIVLCVKMGFWVDDSVALVSSGFGKPIANQLVEDDYHYILPLAASLLANTSQILVSYIYLTYNGLFISMLATAEWVHYSVRRGGLRVAWPRGQQRATSFLSLPYTYVVPIMIASILLHWLLSKNLFLVKITSYEFNDSGSSPSISAMGYSPFAIVFAVLVGGAIGRLRNSNCNSDTIDELLDWVVVEKQEYDLPKEAIRQLYHCYKI